MTERIPSSKTLRTSLIVVTSLVLFLSNLTRVKLVYAQSENNPPTLLAVTPNTVFVGSHGVTLTVSGSGFSNASVVRLNGTAVPTVSTSDTVLTVAAPDSFFSVPGSLFITVANSATVVSEFGLMVLIPTNNAPTITAISPPKAERGAVAGNTIRLKGNDLIGATVSTGGSATVTLLSSTLTDLTFSLAIPDQAPLGTQILTVHNLVGSTSTLSNTGQPLQVEVVDAPPSDPGSFFDTDVLPAGLKFGAGHTTTILQDGRILIAGGGDGPEGRNTLLYSPVSDSWTSTGQMTLARRGHAASLLPDGRVIAVGGTNYGQFTPTAEIYDPASGMWSSAGLTADKSTGAMLLPNGHVLIADRVYDPFTGTFAPAAATDKPARSLPANLATVYPGNVALLLGDGRVLVFKNSSYTYCTGPLRSCNSTTIVSNNLTIYDPAFNSNDSVWAQAAAVPGLQTVVPWVSLSDERVLLGSDMFDPLAFTFNLAATSLGSATNTLMHDGRVFITTEGSSTARIFTPPGVQTTASIISSVTGTPLENGWLGVQLTGSDFAPSALVTLNGTRLVTIFGGSNKLFAFVPSSWSQPLTTDSFSVNNLPGANPSLPALPILSALVPNSAVVGNTISATLSGSNLNGITSVTFDGSGVSATLGAGGTSTQIPITISVASDAALGPRTLKVGTAAGSVSLTAAFTVLGKTSVPSTRPQPISEVELGTIQSGYVVITPDSSSNAPIPTVTFGIVNNGTIQSQAGVFPQAMTTDASLFADVVPSINRNLGIAIANPGSSVNVVTVTLRDTNGSTIGNSVVLNLQPLQHVAQFVDELFPNDALGSGFQGTLELQSSIPFALMGLRFSDGDFSTLPAAESVTVFGVPTRSFNTSSSAPGALAGTVGGNTSLVIPQFAMGGGWATQLSLVNTTATIISGRVDIFDSAGKSLAVKLNGNTQSTFVYSILPHGAFVLAPRDVNGQSPF